MLDETGKEPNYRYKAVASKLVEMIRSDVLRIGMRAPSLREFARQNRVSITTALQAYRLLEDRGILEARPKSGFYVAKLGEPVRDVPALASPSGRPTKVALDSNVLAILEMASKPEVAPLGCAIPSTKLLSSQQLDRHLARIARTQGAELNIYTETQGDLMLRQQIARRSMRLGHTLPPDDIVVTCGCTEALSVALAATTKPGDTVAIECPTYFGLLQVLEARNLKAVELPTHPIDGVDTDALKQTLGRRRIAACLFSSSFNNPLGCLASESKKLEVMEILSEFEVPLIEDDIYGDIYFGDERPRSFAALQPEADVITCSSFSKTIAPGYRVGWVSSSRHLSAILHAKFASTLCGPILPQRAMAAFLESGGYDRHLKRLRNGLSDNIERMSRAIDSSFPPDTRVTAPKGGFVLWLELPRGLSSLELYKRAIEEGICFVPGQLFSATGQFDNCMRLSCGHEWSRNLEKSVVRLGQLAHEII